jgi:histidinol-phosphate aminotransferase
MSWRSNIRDEIRSLPTPAPRSCEGVCLDANESPYGISAETSAELARHLASVVLNRYPDSTAERLRRQLGGELGVDPEGVVIGSGTEELTRLLSATFSKLKPRETRPRVAYPLPGPATYRVAVLSQGARPLELPLREGFELDLVAMERQITGGHPNLLVLSRPNDPTGNLWSRDEMERAISEHPDMVVAVDESYVDYSGDSLLDLLPKNPHLVILRSLSKVGLAGLRVGYLVGHPELVAEVNKVRPEFSVSTLVQEAALFLLQNHASERAEAVARVIAERERLATALQALADVTVFPSVTNFLLIQTPDGSGVGRALRKRGFMVSDASESGSPLTANCLRVSVGLPEENDRLVAILPEAIAQPEPAPPVSRHKQAEVVASPEEEVATPGLPKFF